MVINQSEKRREPRIPLELEGLLQKVKERNVKKCLIKNLSLHGALIFFDEPLKNQENVLVQIKNNGTSHEVSGVVKWCRNGSLPYKIGLYFNEELNFSIQFKEIFSSLKDVCKVPYKLDYTVKQPFSNIYLDLIKNSIGQIHMGYMCRFLKTKIVNLFQTINTEINLVDLAVQRILKISNDTKNGIPKEASLFFYQHFNNLNSELNKVRTFIKILDKEVKEIPDYNINLVEINKIVVSSINNFYRNIYSIKEVECTSNISKNIPAFIGNKYLIEKSIGMIFTFHTNYVFFCNANKINVSTDYKEDKRNIVIKFTSNGSKMFNEDIYIEKTRLINKNFQNSFLNYLAFIILILEEYNPSIRIVSEPGNNLFELNFSVDPIIIES